jgi:Skp family chaperone for outer membrane proteins
MRHLSPRTLGLACLALLLAAALPSRSYGETMQQCIDRVTGNYLADLVVLGTQLDKDTVTLQAASDALAKAQKAEAAAQKELNDVQAKVNAYLDEIAAQRDKELAQVQKQVDHGGIGGDQAQQKIQDIWARYNKLKAKAKAVLHAAQAAYDKAQTATDAATAAVQAAQDQVAKDEAAEAARKQQELQELQACNGLPQD